MTMWNQVFTELLHENGRGNLWGNWGLEAGLQPGVVGCLKPDGNFVACGVLPEIRLDRYPSSQAWSLKSLSTTRRDGNFDVAADGSLLPATGTFQIKWDFAKAQTMASEFAVVEERHLRDAVTTVSANEAMLTKLAASVGMAPNGKPAQGFGVVTQVIMAKSGLNVGAEVANSSFSLGFHVSADIAAKQFLGTATGNAKYDSSWEKGHISKLCFPSVGVSADDANLIPIAFSFLSFHNGIIIPCWINHFGTLQLEVSLCQTYIVDVTVSYDVPGVMTPITETFRLLSGQSHSVYPPCEATNIVMQTTAVIPKGQKGPEGRWQAPLLEWVGGVHHIKLGGFSPSGIHIQSER